MHYRSFLVGLVSAYLSIVLFALAVWSLNLPSGAITEIHVEALSNDVAFNKILSMPKNIMLMVLVPQKNLERVKALLDYPIGLHVHIAVQVEMDSISYMSQLELINQSKLVLEHISERKILDFASGYWAYNEDTLKVCSALEMRFHVWKGLPNNVAKKYPINIVEVQNYCHDWD